MMFEYFRGWKRKAGLVTLLMACVFAACWIRSTLVQTTVSFPTGFTTFHEIIVGYGAIVWGRMFFRPGEVQRGSEWTETKLTKGVDSAFELLDDDTPWSVRFLGFGVSNFSVPNDLAESQQNDPIGISLVVIPFWLINFPIAAVSAWLLLSKRRQPTKPEPPQEPAV